MAAQKAVELASKGLLEERGYVVSDIYLTTSHLGCQ